MEGIRKVQARRKEEIVGTANRNSNMTGRQQDDKGRDLFTLPVFLFFEMVFAFTI